MQQVLDTPRGAGPIVGHAEIQKFRDDGCARSSAACRHRLPLC
jgi:hypothetical protein